MVSSKILKMCLNKFVDKETSSISHIISKTILASVLASNGLLYNSMVSLIPSMLISPIGSLLISTATNIVLMIKGRINIRKKTLLNFVIKSILILLLTIFIGFVYGYMHIKWTEKEIILPTTEMKSRSSKQGLFGTGIIAIACAWAFPWAFFNQDIATMISIGIATALLPPLVNIGLTSGTYYSNKSLYEGKKHWITDSKLYGTIIFLINASALTLGCILYIMYKPCRK